VRAGTPCDKTAALTSAKLGEACGYGKHNDTLCSAFLNQGTNSNSVSLPVNVVASAEIIPNSHNSEFHDLKSQIQHLTQIVSGLVVKNDQASATYESP